MSVEVKEIQCKGDLLREFFVTIPHDEIAAKVQSELKNRAQVVRVAGFRPGKVPLSLVEQRHGDEIVSDVLDKMLNESAQKVIQENKLKPAMRPHFHPKAQYKRGEDFCYTLHVEVLPEIGAVDLTSWEITQYKIKKDLKKITHLNELRAKAAGENKPITEKRQTKLGDIVKIDFDGKIGNEPLKGGQAQGYELELGARQFIPGFEEGLVGHDKGKNLTLNLAFPKDYHEKTLAGKDVAFDVTIHEIMERVPAALDDELAKKHGFENLKAMEEANEKILETSHSKMERSHAKQEVLNKLASVYSFPVPAGMVKLELESIFHQLAEEEGISQPTEENLEAWAKEYGKIAERRVRLGLVLAEVGKKNNIDVSQKELTDAVLKETQQYPGQENAVIDYYRKNSGAINHVRAQILEEKTIDFILKNVKIKEKEISEEELLKIGEAAEIL